MQAQSDIGIFGCVRCSLVQIDLVEAQLAGALTGDILVMDGFDAQVFSRR